MNGQGASASAETNSDAENHIRDTDAPDAKALVNAAPDARRRIQVYKHSNENASFRRYVGDLVYQLTTPSSTGS